MPDTLFTCRPGCAACCIAPSISGPIPDLHGCGQHAKLAGQACVQLDEQLRCRLFGQASRPRVCSSLQPHPDMCGTTGNAELDRAHAMHYLQQLEIDTAPASCA